MYSLVSGPKISKVLQVNYYLLRFKCASLFKVDNGSLIDKPFSFLLYVRAVLMMLDVRGRCHRICSYAYRHFELFSGLGSQKRICTLKDN